MGLPELFLISLGLSMDAFAVALCKGLSSKEPPLKTALIAGLYFGFFQGAMPLAGYLIGSQFAEYIKAYDHWVAFILLLLIGLHMIKESFSKDDIKKTKSDLTIRAMLPLAVATSIDALAVGVSFAFLQVNIITAVLCIGITTFILSGVGTRIGHAIGTKFKSRAELAGGIILILMGLKILLSDTGVISF